MKYFIRMEEEIIFIKLHKKLLDCSTKTRNEKENFSRERKQFHLKMKSDLKIAKSSVFVLRSWNYSSNFRDDFSQIMRDDGKWMKR